MTARDLSEHVGLLRLQNTFNGSLFTLFHWVDDTLTQETYKKRLTSKELIENESQSHPNRPEIVVSY